MSQTDRAVIARMQREIQELRSRTRLIPVRWGVSAASAEYQTLSVLGGNAALIGGSIEGIQYASTVTPAAVYDPNVTTVYPAGLGYGVLFKNGVRQSGNVLIRHDYYGNQWAVLQSALLRVAGTVSLSYDPGTGPVTMTCYTFDWI